jgi:hypothetical protein
MVCQALQFYGPTIIKGEKKDGKGVEMSEPTFYGSVDWQTDPTAPTIIGALGPSIN